MGIERLRRRASPLLDAAERSPIWPAVRRQARTINDMRTMTIVAATLMLAGAAFGADISGKWKGSFQGGPDGAIEQNYAFKVDGEKLTGTMSDPMLGEAKISDGKISGADLSFTVSASGQMGDMKLTFKGKVVNENEITLTFSFSGGPGGDGGGPEGGMQIALKRVK
jgi:hypothetical protein